MEVDDAFGLQTKQKIEEIANAKWHLLFQCLILHHTSSELIDLLWSWGQALWPQGNDAGWRSASLGDSAGQAGLMSLDNIRGSPAAGGPALLPPPLYGCCGNPASSWLFLLDKPRRAAGLPERRPKGLVPASTFCGD